MLSFFKTHNLDKWFYTEHLNIEGGSIPHSHPILTLTPKTRGTNYLEDDLALLATYIHEQLHWFLSLQENHHSTKAAITKLKSIYPDLPIGWPEGCKSEYSNYLHIIINFLEYKALTELVGQKVAKKRLTDVNHYKGIYSLVSEELEQIEQVLMLFDLLPNNLPPTQKVFVSVTN